MMTEQSNGFRMRARAVFRSIFHLLLHQLGIRRFRAHSFFAPLLGQSATIADFGAHRGEFFAVLKSEYSISRALLVEADPVFALVLAGGRNNGDDVTVPAVDVAHAIREVGGQVDLVKFDVEGAEVDVLRAVVSSDLARCSQLSVEFHDQRPPFTRPDVDRVCQRMRREGYSIANASWPFVEDVLFVNLKSMPALRRIGFRCRLALANAFVIMRGAVFDCLSSKRI